MSESLKCIKLTLTHTINKLQADTRIPPTHTSLEPCGTPASVSQPLVMKDEWTDKCNTNVDDYICAQFPSPAGGLPLELWWDILEMIENPRSLLACGCTCKTFRDVVRKIISSRIDQARDFETGAAKAALATDPTRGYFYDHLCFWSNDFMSWLSTFPTSGRLNDIDVDGGWHHETRPVLTLRFQMRLALSRLKTVTKLSLHDVRFSSFSDFARTICSLPSLSKLHLWDVTVNDSRTESLEDVYFARALRLEELDFQGAFGELHPIPNLLTAPALSESLAYIELGFSDNVWEQVIGQSHISPALLPSSTLERLHEVQLGLWQLSCEGHRDVALIDLLARTPSNYISAVQIEFCCRHSTPHLNEWGRLFPILDNVFSSIEFTLLRAIPLMLKTDFPVNIDRVCAIVGSQSHSSKWRNMLTGASITFASSDGEQSDSSSELSSEEAGETTEGHYPDEAVLSPRLNSPKWTELLTGRNPSCMSSDFDSRQSPNSSEPTLEGAEETTEGQHSDGIILNICLGEPCSYGYQVTVVYQSLLYS
ncbi:hypothetical protein CERSUDRAFT_120419 [Gelatoporia subvermispora B]|uniref:F-box domain-containing protein n=1 Tax=Ceriporiopsis subvermispora (strain B) TaxID=914234 RepID=M2RQQ6_CERS8|nr:hypothetical protein CERSUDRAFT_120419 [Gelatoporia subvermispora B]